MKTEDVKPDETQSEQAAPTGTSGEAIGRPKAWQETRYQQAGKPVDASVDSVVPAPDAQNQDKISTRVSRIDYESLEKPGPRHRDKDGSTY